MNLVQDCFSLILYQYWRTKELRLLLVIWMLTFRGRPLSGETRLLLGQPGEVGGAPLDGP